jgi:hypothetical protein
MVCSRARLYISTDDRLEDILNKSWTIIAQGLFTLREINQMTRTRQVYISTDDILKSWTIVARGLFTLREINLMVRGRAKVYLEDDHLEDTQWAII